ncbi:MAG: hypothetical protein ACM336_08970 [Acidobacteriota bacterium]
MADFRKLFLVLAVMAFAATAFAQTSPFVCVGNPAVPETLRGGGLTEELGNVVLTCSGGAADGTASGSFEVFIPAPAIAITNRLGASVAGIGNELVGVALTVEDGAGNVGSITKGVFSPSFPNRLSFANVSIPTGTTSIVRIAGIRVAVPAASTIPVTVSEFISTSPAAQIPVTNSTQVVGSIYPAIDFAVTDCSGTAALSGLSFAQCKDFNLSGGDPSGKLSFAVKFAEGFSTAFKIKNASADPKNNGEFSNKNGDDPIGIDTATRLLLTLTNVPAGVTIRVTDHAINGTADLNAAFVGGSVNVKGVGGTPVADVSGSPAFCEKLVTEANPDGTIAGVGLVDAKSANGTVFAVWEVTAATLNRESLIFGVEVSFASDPANDHPGLTNGNPAVAHGNIGPQSDVAIAADDKVSIPRFSTTAFDAPTFNINPCVTNLLFPYVTSVQGYDTGFALVNTSKDNGTGEDNPLPFNTSSQTGLCTVYYFGNQDVAPQQTKSLHGGEMAKFTLTAGGDGVAATPGFEGYIIAQCNFQYAHGFGFISAAGSGLSAQAYLALVIPDRGGARPAQSFTDSEGGEQLIH